MPRLEDYRIVAMSRSHKARVAQALDIIRRAASCGRVVVSTSWGKDSTVLCDLAIRALGRVDLFHIGSPAALPGSEDTAAHFSALAPLHVSTRISSLPEYIAWVRSVGLPHERTKAQQSAVVQALKRGLGEAWAEENGFQVQFLGLRISEKGPRAAVLRSRGPLYQRVSGMWVGCPLAYWSSQDVWAYILDRVLPYNRRIYDAETHGFTRETLRNTGWMSTDGAHNGQIVWLKHNFPDQYAMLVKEFPGVKAYV